MNLCINPSCSQPENSANNRFCANCGSELSLHSRYRVIKRLDNSQYEIQASGGDITKILQVLISSDSQELEYFQKTAEVLQQLNHPGIPKVEVDGYFVYFPRNRTIPLHCLAMEKIEGISLEEYLRNQENHPLDENLVINWLQQVIKIIESIHHQNILHLQIKPSNILLQPDGNLALIGFGQGEVIQEAKFIADYTPPEQINHITLPQSDFFALGRTFAFLITGKSPTNHLDLYEPTLETTTWRNFASHIAPQFLDLLDAMMENAPMRRPENTQVILQILAQINPIATPSRPQKILSYQSKLSFLFSWIFATVTSGTVTALLGYFFGLAAAFLIGVIAKNVTIGFILGGAIFGLITGIAIGLMQYLVLRQHEYKFKRWIFITALGFAIEGAMGVLAGNYGRQGGAIFIPGIALGILQWWVLQRQVKQAWLWILANIGGGVVAVGINKTANYSVFGNVLGLIGFAMVTGVVLLVLLRIHKN